MQTRLISAALVLSFATAGAMAQTSFAGADDSGFPGVAAVQGPGKTRAEVKAELARAQRDGAIISAGEGNAFVNATPVLRTASKSRTEVKAEVVQALRSGELKHTNGVY